SRRARRALDVQAIVALLVHDQAEAARRRCLELPEAAAPVSARAVIVPALDDGEEGEPLGQPFRSEYLAHALEVLRPAREAMGGRDAQRTIVAQPMLPLVDR